MSGLPLDPMTQLQEGAVQAHEFVVSYEGAGFTRAEAMQMLCAVLTASVLRGES